MKTKLPHITLDRDSNPVYRTKLMPKVRAFGFAQCLLSNPRFLRAEAMRSDRAESNECWFVQYVPAREERRTFMEHSLQRVRTLKGEREGRSYQFFSDDRLRGGAVYCLSVSGNVYETSDHGCTCPDFQMRIGGTGIRCKHIEAFRLYAREATVPQCEENDPFAEVAA